MSFLLQPVTLSNVSVAEIDRADEQRAQTLSSLIVSLSIAAVALSLTLAAVITLIVWALG